MSKHGRNHWVKLYVEINDDPKVGLLPVNARWRFVSCLALAGELNEGGFIPAVDDELAYRLHTEVETLQAEMRMLAGRGLAELRKHPDGDERWFLPNFSKRQEPASNAERQQQWRNRNAPVTKSYAKVTTETEYRIQNTEAETEGEGEPPPTRATATRAPVVISQVADRTPTGFQASNGYRPPADEPIPNSEPGMVRAAPEAVRVIWRITGNWPAEDLHDWLADEMGNTPDEDTFRRVYLAWRTRGYKATNYSGLVEWYRQAMAAPNWQPPAQGRPTAAAPGAAPLSRSEEAAAAYAAAKRAVLGGTS